ncbi:MAG: hypothetical protein ABIQ95_08535, partial [Bdellovibrionia bacterium]
PYCGECTSYGFQMWGTVCKEGTIGMIQDSEDPGFHQCLKQTYILTGIMGSIGLLPLFYASYLSGSGFAKKSYERLTNSSPIDRTAESEAAQIEIRKLEDAVEHKIANISQETGISFVREILEEVLSQPSMQ